MKDEFDMQVQRSAKAFAYPPTPDFTARHWRPIRRQRVVRRLARAAAVLLIALAGLLAVPEIRAQVLALFRVGVVEIVVSTATPAIFPGGDLPASVLDFPGATTLAAAQARFPDPIPTSPTLGAPDRVYLIDAERPIVVLAWLKDDGTVDTSLQLLPAGLQVLKMYDGVIEEVQVNGARGVWLPKEHWYMLMTALNQAQMRRVSMPALVWDAGDLTYRLETSRSRGEALAIAEGLEFGNG